MLLWRGASAAPLLLKIRFTRHLGYAFNVTALRFCRQKCTNIMIVFHGLFIPMIVGIFERQRFDAKRNQQQGWRDWQPTIARCDGWIRLRYPLRGGTMCIVYDRQVSYPWRGKDAIFGWIPEGSVSCGSVRAHSPFKIESCAVCAGHHGHAAAGTASHLTIYYILYTIYHILLLYTIYYIL